MEKTKTAAFSDVNDYIAAIADSKQRTLFERVRALIMLTVPQAEEMISYQMPTYRHHGVLIYVAAWKNHWALYPANNAIKEAFKDELSSYKQTKGAIQFPWNEPFPEELIIKLIKKRVEENNAAAALKASKAPR